MHRLATLGLAAALLLGASSVVAEDVTTKSSATVTSSQTDPLTTGSIGTDFNVLMDRLDGDLAVDLSGLTATSSVEFVAIDTLQGWDAKKFDDRIAAKTADLGEWRDRLEMNSSLKAKLDAGGHEFDDIVAIEKVGETFKIYVDDRA